MLDSSYRDSLGRLPKQVAIGVLCGIEPDRDVEAQRLAEELGALIADRGHLLVYGAGGRGLMGAVARGVSSNGGSIMGVLSTLLYEREQCAGAPTQALMLTRDLSGGKLRMLSTADAFVALPGGYTTLDGILEVAVRAQLGLHRKPLVLLDCGDFWKQFSDLIDEMRKRGFIDENTSVFQLAHSAQEALRIVEEGLAT